MAFDWEEQLVERYAVATDEDLAKLSDECGLSLPSDYAAFLKRLNGGTFKDRVVVDLPTWADEGWPEIWLTHLSAAAEFVDEKHKLIKSDVVAEPSGELQAMLRVAHGTYFSLRLDPSALAWHVELGGRARKLPHSFDEIQSAFRKAELQKDELESKIPAFVAVERGDFCELERQLEAGLSPNLRNENGVPLLLEAAGQPRMAAMLIEKGANKNSVDANGRNIIHFAAGRSVDVLRLALRAGGDASALDCYGMSTLACAADIRSFKMLIDHGVDVNASDVFTSCGLTAQHCEILDQAGYDFSSDHDWLRRRIADHVEGNRDRSATEICELVESMGAHANSLEPDLQRWRKQTRDELDFNAISSTIKALTIRGV